jgi:hypothetical protein
MNTTIRTAVFGFIAAAISVLVSHQVMVLALHLAGLIPNAPYSFRPNAWGVPILLNSIFWGGLWGVAFAFFAGKLPGDTWLKGLLAGWIGPLLLGNWIILPLIRGQAMFAGFVPMRMLIGALIGGAFGIGWIYIHNAMTRRRAAA